MAFVRLAVDNAVGTTVTDEVTAADVGTAVDNCGGGSENLCSLVC